MSAMPTFVKPHAHIRPECGACGTLFRQDDGIATIFTTSIPPPERDDYGDAFGSSETGECDRASPCPWVYGYGKQCEGVRLGGGPLETATVHKDCLDLFIAKTLGQERLERAWAKPGLRCPWADDAPTLKHSSAGNYVAETHHGDGLPAFRQLHSLPPEVAKNVRNSKSHSDLILRRYGSIVSFAAQTSDIDEDEPVSFVPLTDIAHWKRGGSPELRTGANDEKPIVRLAIDSRGLKEVERLKVVPILSDSQDEHVTYAIATDEEVKELGLGNLVMQPWPNLTLWDTPTRPPEKQRLVPPECDEELDRLTTHHLRGCAGLTFVSSGLTHAIHVHTYAEPQARATSEPLPSHLRRNSSPWPDSPSSAIVGSKHQPEECGCPVSPVQYLHPPFKATPLEETYFTWASLSNVVRAQVFYSDYTHVCKGITLEYADESIRALGSCRPGKDPVQHSVLPTNLCLTPAAASEEAAASPYGMRSPIVEITNDFEHDHDGEWECHDMASGLESTLEFWFTAHESIVKVTYAD